MGFISWLLVDASFSGGRYGSALSSAALFAIHSSSCYGRKAECRTVHIIFQPKFYSMLNIFNVTQTLTAFVTHTGHSNATKN
jgi:hypothetical protein